VVAGTFHHRAVELVSGWHQHELHEIEYAVSGVAEMRTETSHYLLPPQHAVWIPAGVPHCPVLRDVETIAVFFDPSAFVFEQDRALVLAVPSVLREMIRYATRWPIGRPVTGDEADATAFFEAMAVVVRGQLAHETPLSLPVSDDPLIAAVMEHTTANLADVTAASVCRAVGISTRTLRRRFPALVGQTWRDYVHQARLVRAMALLAEPRRSIVEVALTVGFESPTAFARAFRAWTGEAPSSYRQHFRR
jgi:AraC-like DNA-binding protein